MKNVLAFALCLFGCLTSWGACYGEDVDPREWRLCWVLTSAGSCGSHFGNRIPDFGCNGCDNMNVCVNSQNALRSVTEPFWSTNLPAAAYLDDFAIPSYEVTPDVKTCASSFNCHPTCFFNMETGNMGCMVSTVLQTWDMFYDSIIRTCGVIA